MADSQSFTEKWANVIKAKRERRIAWAKGAQKENGNRENAKRPKRKSLKYHDYVKSAAWAKKRKRALMMLGSKCRICGSIDRLHVHHKTYKNLGHEPMSDLEILCEPCHANEHEGKVFAVNDPMTKEFRQIME